LGSMAVIPLVAATLGLALLIVAAVLFANSRGFGYDFVAYDAAARRIAAGAPLYLADTAERYRQQLYDGLYLYPPQLAIALVPLTVLSTFDATVAWMVFRIGLLIAGCALMPVSRSARLLTFAVGCASLPVLFDLNLGNISIVVLVLAALAWRMSDRPIGAVAHAALIAMRFPFGVFFITWIFQRRGRPIVWTIAAGIGLILVSLPIVGVGQYMDYLTILRNLPDISTGPHNLSLKSTALEIGIPGDVAGLAVPLGYVAGALAIVFAARRRDRDVAFVVSVVATLLLTPFIHPHYLVLMLFPTALLLDRGQRWAIVLPLFAWLPGAVLPLLAPIAIAALLVPARRPPPAS
ncbi:MAG: DUF2029 domain-containing protein, partial [Chloroflexi bacterium]|nr:DUF2029 domain-containing protein [Chloroflexota bacterium]